LSRGAAKRRYRLRRKRRDDAADRAPDATDAEVVGEFGCCLVETVGGLSVLAALMFVPYVLLS
jgi:hypothetical protein